MQIIRNSAEVILVLVPEGKDSSLAASVIEVAGLRAEVCADMAQLHRRLAEDSESVGTILLAEEIIPSARELSRLIDWLRDQEPWSDLPIVLLTLRGISSEQSTQQFQEIFEPVGVVTVLERPMRQSTLITALQVALRARRRQYQVRDLLAKERENAAALQAANAEAQAASRAKDQFLAVLSHELRTPLNAILGWTQLLIADPDDRETRDTALEVIERNTRSQVQLIEDLLDVSRITSGKLRLDVRPIHPCTVVQAALDTVRPAAHARAITLHYFPLTQPCMVNADPDRLQQVVWNLLTNAIKFTPQHGNVHVRTDRFAGAFELTVTDDGMGIGAEFLPAVFERFTQADTSSTRVHTGLGLGLAICRHLVEQHGGSISVASPGLGQGTTFTMRLPVLEVVTDGLGNGAGLPGGRVIPARVSRSGPEKHGELDGLRILVVDDDADARSLLDQLLTRQGAEVLLATNGDEAFHAVAHMAPDVLLCDIEMSGEDGYHLIKRIRSLPPAEGGTLPAAAVTAYARSEDRQRALDAGFQHHVSKPIDPVKIGELVVSMVLRSMPVVAER